MGEILCVCETQFSNLPMQYIFQILLAWKIRFTHRSISDV